MQPTRSSSAMASIRPDPQIPTGFPPPTTLYSAIWPSGLSEICSMAPVVARMPQVIPPPSKDGPAEAEQHTSQSEFPMTSSPFVPRSIRSERSSESVMPVTRTSATTSPPT